jgi:transcriptional regulator with XRE-family HTH domain
MTLLRQSLGDVLRRNRKRQSRTLRDVAATARVSLGYLSEVERGRKEASSELLASICDALEVPLADVLAEVSTSLRADHAAATVTSATSAPVSAPSVLAAPAAAAPPAPAAHSAKLRIAA